MSYISSIMSEKWLQQLSELAKKISSIEQQHQQIIITLDQVDAQDKQQLQQCIKQLQALNPSPDYQPYFQAVIDNPIYKPGNPILALRHVANSYQLDLEQFKQAFKGRK